MPATDFRKKSSKPAGDLTSSEKRVVARGDEAEARERADAALSMAQLDHAEFCEVKKLLKLLKDRRRA